MDDSVETKIRPGIRNLDEVYLDAIAVEWR